MSLDKKKVHKQTKRDKCDHVWDVISKSPLNKKIRDYIKIEKKCRICKDHMYFIEKKN